MTAGNSAPIRLAELVATLSLATDLGMGQPLEQALRTCLLATAAGRELGLERPAQADVYYLALLRFVGCTADAYEQAALVGGDEIAYYAGVAPVLMGETSEYLGYLLRRFASEVPPLTRARIIGRVLADGASGAKRSIAIHCEVARMLAARMSLPVSIGANAAHLFERWDGKGLPGDLAGEEIPLPARIVAAARDVELFCRLGGWDTAAEVLRGRRARSYDPAVVDCFLAHGERWLGGMADAPVWEEALAAEPAPWLWVAETRFDTVLEAFAAFADLKSPYTRGHSLGVAALAAEAARHAGLADVEAVAVRRAALVHDLGRTGIPNGIWDKPGPLTPLEWERVRLHPYLTERILARAGALASLASLAGAHHERLDGSGYYRGAPAALLPPAARLLAAADVYQAMTQERPHRPARSPEAAARELAAEVDGGRLDGNAVNCVLAAAGQRRLRRHPWPAGLSEREVEVLRLIARGASYKAVAAHLSISPRTAEHHVTTSTPRSASQAGRRPRSSPWSIICWTSDRAAQKPIPPFLPFQHFLYQPEIGEIPDATLPTAPYSDDHDRQERSCRPQPPCHQPGGPPWPASIGLTACSEHCNTRLHAAAAWAPPWPYWRGVFPAPAA